MEKYEDDLTEIVSLWQFGLGEILEKCRQMIYY